MSILTGLASIPNVHMCIVSCRLAGFHSVFHNSGGANCSSQVARVYCCVHIMTNNVT